MRIDVHTHIFTLRTILSLEAVKVITQRLRDREKPKLPDFLVDAVERLLDDLLDKPRYLDERHLLRLLIQKLTGVQSFNALLAGQLPGGPLSVQLGGDLDALGVDALRALLRKVGEAQGGEEVGKSIMDVVETLRASMQPTITHVADDILRHMGEDDVMVALMMDIFGAPESERDRRNYLAQINGTAEAALQRPGRILPFFGVHPDRPGHLDELRKAVRTKGFVGVKLYPSLDYAVDSEEMKAVYRFCVEAHLPVLLHCGHGGFYRTKDAIDQCDPDHWKGILESAEFKDLRVCFAHFGGWEALGMRHALDENWPPGTDPDGNWGKKIYDYMVKYPDRVFTDLAYHTEQFLDPQHQQTYFDTLQELLDDPKIGPRILYGTDAWLLRLDMTPEAYWDLWKGAAGGTLDAITRVGPRRFLGFPDDDQGALRPNLENFVRHMQANRARLGKSPAGWLRDRLEGPATADRDPPEWDFTKLAVRDTYQFLGQFLSDRQRAQGYRQNRFLKLKELPYHDPRDPNFGGRCRDLARRFIDFADQDLTYAGGHSFGSAVDLFVDVFKDGEMTFAQVALALDSVIRYPEPLA